MKVWNINNAMKRLFQILCCSLCILFPPASGFHPWAGMLSSGYLKSGKDVDS